MDNLISKGEVQQQQIALLKNNIDEIDLLIKSRNFAAFNFRSDGKTMSNLTDKEYKHHVELAKNIVRVATYFSWYFQKSSHNHLKEMNSMSIEP